ncbi:MAG: hypothetical protein B6D56_08025 [Candidatus Omnitrophica bacterium 4484_70.1]|nr:MAG: hypothetical protein B6D56_08025 [Candidatus Omnitrophica bacterium 4484_70.1]
MRILKLLLLIFLIYNLAGFCQEKAIDKFRKEKEETKKGKDLEKEVEKIKKLRGREKIPLEEIVIPVIAFRIKKVDFKETIPILGTIKPFEKIKLKFEIKGKVKRVYKKEGEEVKKGEILAELDENEFLLREDYAKNKYIAEKNTYLSMEKEYQLKEKLYEKGAILKDKLEEAKLKLEAQKYKMKAAESEWQLAQEDLKKIKLISPCNGVIDEKKIEEGEIAFPQDEVFTILKVDKVYAEVGITEKDIAKVKKGLKAQIKTDAYPQEKFSGVVKNILPSIKGISRTLTLKIEIDNKKGLLLPGMFIRGDIILADLKDVYVVPKEALLKTGPQYIMVFIKPQEKITQEKLEKEGVKGIIEIRGVEVKYVGEKYAQVSGVKEGELIVFQATKTLSPASSVKIISIEEYKGGEE